MSKAQRRPAPTKKPRRGFWHLYRTSLVGDLSVISKSFSRTRERFAKLAEEREASARHETFQEATQRLGISEDRLEKTLHALELRAAIWFALCAVAFCSLTLSGISAHPVNQAVLSIGVLLLGASQAAKSRFRAAQIHRRQLFGFWAWLTGARTK